MPTEKTLASFTNSDVLSDFPVFFPGYRFSPWDLKTPWVLPVPFYICLHEYIHTHSDTANAFLLIYFLLPLCLGGLKARVDG